MAFLDLSVHNGYGAGTAISLRRMKPSLYFITANPIAYAMINGIDIRYEYVITRLKAPE
jgi:hypothetical protein